VLRQTRVLVICTANVCRSPAGAALLQDELDKLGVDAAVTSAGTQDTRRPVDPVMVAAARERGLDLSHHVPRLVTPEILERDGADLVLTMTREHLRTVVTLRTSVWPRTFTLLELAHRCRQSSHLDAADTSRWVAELGRDRKPSQLLGPSDRDDLDDPYGRGRSATVGALDRLAAATRAIAQHGVWRSPVP